MNALDASRAFPQLLKSVASHEARVVVEADGEPLAAIISLEDLTLLTELEAERARRWSIIDEIHTRNRDKDPEEAELDVAEAIAAVRKRARGANRSA